MDNSEYFASGITYGTIFGMGAFTPNKCKECGEYPVIWHNKLGWQVECKCGRISDKIMFDAIVRWNNIYGDNFNWTEVINYLKDKNNNSAISNYQFEKNCCDCIE